MDHRMNPCFETLFLLANKDWDERSEKQAIEVLDGFGVEGAAFYHANFRMIERYYAAFQKKMVPSAGTKLFDDCDETTLLAYAAVFLCHPAWFDPTKVPDDEAVLQAVEEAFSEDAENNGQSVVDVLESGDFSDRAKWQIMALLQQPKQRIELVAQAVQDNLSAFEHAYAKVKPEADVLLNQFDLRSNENQPTSFMKLSRKIDEKTEMVPILAEPLMVCIAEGMCLYGLLVDRLTNEEEPGFTKAELLIGAKALSDASKIAILLALKEGSLYNLEIAERVGLTPATTSHHMNNLLAAGFVDIEKRNGKVYYQLAEDRIERFLKGAGDLLVQ
ncbi:MAG: ArsR/SmtB family transcription factor [Eggerthellaceae bacterium]